MTSITCNFNYTFLFSDFSMFPFLLLCSLQYPYTHLEMCAPLPVIFQALSMTYKNLPVFSNPISFKLTKDNYLASKHQALATIKDHNLLSYITDSQESSSSSHLTAQHDFFHSCSKLYTLECLDAPLHINGEKD
ncbi:hypothetical protein VNO77_32987 [Canavalia gladiata]|uniref:Uncharacterized protein n=1 Tax=Canavalia gladiata TaxID=3824 RepID=A0AAN9Q012_CANGL